MHVNDIYPSKYLRGLDLNGKAWDLTVNSVTIETVGKPGQQEEKPVVWFDGTDRGLICNKTNLIAIARLHGPETDEWAGRTIGLRPERVRAFGDEHLVIRVGPPTRK